MRNFAISFSLLLVVATGFGQDFSYEKQSFKIVRSAVVDPMKQGPSYNPVLQNLEMPKPGTDRARLLEIKEQLRQKYPQKPVTRKSGSPTTSSVTQPTIGNNFDGQPSGNSVPNDNNMAISNDGIIISCINQTIWAWDVNEDSLIFNKYLGQLAQPLFISGSKFDPKIVYDPDMDRFICVFLNGFTPTTSYIIVCFTSTNDPRDPWYLFALSGNPMNDTTWADYPAISITKDELFITINQLIPNQSWQTAFVQSLIWQVDKNAAFAGDTVLNVDLWSGIGFGNTMIRNLNPIEGGMEPHGPNAYFLSNRNFDLQNDTIFVVEITDNMASNNAALKIKYGRTNVPYGVPPSARQSNNHTFDTNDGRVLGGFSENGRIQFVANTAYYLIDGPDTFVYAAVYHGLVDSLMNDVPHITGNIIYDKDTVMDFGYPNIAFTGNQYCDNEAIIAFNHTAPTVFSGSSCVYYSNDQKYSDPLELKAGDNYVDALFGTYERWGDYSGIQRKYNEPGKVWTGTSWGDNNKRSRTWLTEIAAPDTSMSPTASNLMAVATIDSTDMSIFSLCDGAVGATAVGGIEPYTYLWDDPELQTGSLALGLCEGTYHITISDAHNCTVTAVASISEPDPGAAIFPNPTQDMLMLNFELSSDKMIEAAVYDVRGRLVKILLQEKAKEGRNLFSFSMAPLATGTYIVKITTNDVEILSEKFVKF